MPEPYLTELWLIRHCESVGNRDGILQGHADLPLSERGHEQARSLAGRLKGQRFAALYSSDLARARETARPLGEALGLVPAAERRLREVDVGAWNGLSLDEIRARVPAEWQAWRTRPPDLRRGGGETYREAAARMNGLLDALARAHLGERVLVVTHGTVIQLALGVTARMDFSQVWRLRVANASITRVRPFVGAVSSPALPAGQIITLNDVGHLDGTDGVEGDG